MSIPGLDLRWDVAISFAGKDREVASRVVRRLEERGLSVYYDEAARAETVGEDLFERLQKIYVRQARCCVAIISEHYVAERWPRFELKAAQERLLDDEGYLLPIRLDDTAVPGLPASIGYASMADLDAVVEAAARRAKLDKATEAAEGQARPARLSSPTPQPWVPLDGSFERHVGHDIIEITEPDLVERCQSLPETRDEWLGWRLACDMVRHLAWSTDVKTETAYTCWRSGTILYVSMVPGVMTHGQQTLEFKIAGKSLFLVASWRSEASAWARFQFREYHNAVQGLMADRSGLDVSREGSILALKKRGAAFGFPVVPRAGDAEELCSWLEEELEAMPFDWDRDPRLGSPRIGVWLDGHHVASGALVLVFMLYGSWTNAALYMLRDAFEALLPERSTRFMCSPGAMRIIVLLGSAEATGLDSIDKGAVAAVVDAVHLILARACASQDGLPLAPLDARVTIPAPFWEEQGALQSAHEALGSKEHPEVSDDWAPSPAEWLKPRHSLLNVEYDLAPRFNFAHVSSQNKLQEYIAMLEDRLAQALE